MKVAKAAFPCTNECKPISINVMASPWVTENKCSLKDPKHFNY